MKERPILFSAPMVRALLAGTKTQTRRVCKPADAACLSHVVEVPDPAERGQVYNGSTFGDEEGALQFSCPYGGRGERLWVREAWKAHTTFDHLPPRDLPESHVWYVADEGYKAESRYRQGMFMPRWASRILLEVTDVHVERLHDISEADAAGEGVLFSTSHVGHWSGTGERWWMTAREAFRDLWISINGEGSWDANPWVWVVNFRRMTP